MAQTYSLTRNQKTLFAKSTSYTFLLFWLFITLFPILWMVSTSFKPPQEWFAWPPHWIPAEATINNYEEILAIGPGGTGSEDSQLGGAQQVLTAILPVRDSLIVAIISSFISVTLGSFLAYTISRYQTGGKRYPYILLMIRMMPPIVIAVPVLAYFTLPWWRGALHDNYLGLIIPYVLVTVPYAVWLMLSFMQDVPRGIGKCGADDGGGPDTCYAEGDLPADTAGFGRDVYFHLHFELERVLARLHVGRPGTGDSHRSAQPI